MCRHRRNVDEMPEVLRTEHRQRGGDAVQNAFDVDVNRLVPLFGPQVIKGGNRRDAGIIDENIQFAEPITSQLDQGNEVLTSFYVCGKANRFATGLANAYGEGRKAVFAPRP